VDAAELLAEHDVNPPDLQPAPANPTWKQISARIQSATACTVCGDAPSTVQIADVPDCGPRWVELCQAHSAAVWPTAPGTQSAGDLLAEVREVAREVGVPPTAGLA
jgi:hypothetical protein